MKLAMLRSLFGLVLAAVCAVSEAAMQNVPCDAPFVFRDAAVNVVVLPFAMPRRDSPTANRIAQLVQRETLSSIAKFGSVGTVQLTQTSHAACEPEIVRAQLLGERFGARAAIEPGRGLVMVWGRIVESGDALYTQVFVDFVRRGVRERLELPLSQEKLAGALSAQGFAGPQRRIDRALLERIDTFAARNSVLYESPDATSPQVKIPAGLPFHYYVTEVRGEWMRVTAFSPDQVPPNQFMPDRGVFAKHQWMRAVASETDWTLRKVLPEMAFIEAVAGYLAVRDALGHAAPGATPPALHAMVAASARAFDEYEGNMRSNSLAGERDLIDERYAAARAVTAELQGMLRMLPPERSQTDTHMARQKFALSSRLQPASADSRNLTLMTDLYLAERQAASPDEPLRSVGSLLATIGLAPANASVQANLRAACRWLLGQAGARPAAWRPLSAEEQTKMEETLGALDSVMATR
jgi:hypothetical protein